MAKGKARRIEIMDTTLRDGEQAEGISMMPEEKRTIAQRLLEVVKVDRIEVASARVSDGERRAVKTIIDHVESKGMTDRVEILGFVDGNRSVDWAKSVGARVINLLTKGSLHHCREQLRKTHDQHLDDIRKTVDYGVKQGIAFNVYLEDWSGGMLGCADYVHDHIAALLDMPVTRIMLPDTLGLLSPPQVREFVGRIIAAFPDRHFDFHGHDDYGVGTANTLEAALAGVRGVHVTVNGMGERAGNVTLDEVVVALRDHAGIRTSVDERALSDISKLVEVFSGRRVPANKPIVGENVFTQTAGIHADGDMKGNLYESRLTPARFGRHRTYAMGKLMASGSTSL
jgi:(R)-citramalate synthase